MQRDVEKLVYDLQSAANDIQQFVAKMTYEDYHANKLVKVAVERKFEIIGEAMNRLGRLSPSAVTAIRDHEKIISFRNLVIHGYDVVSDPIVWDVIQGKLPTLIEDLNKFDIS